MDQIQNKLYQPYESQLSRMTSYVALSDNFSLNRDISSISC